LQDPGILSSVGDESSACCLEADVRRHLTERRGEESTPLLDHLAAERFDKITDGFVTGT
jgi:hypothetical protein